jgi:hypothetical protein
LLQPLGILDGPEIATIRYRVEAHRIEVGNDHLAQLLERSDAPLKLVGRDEHER